MRISLLHRYYPIVNLEPEKFWVAYWQVVQCHFRLWKLGVAHGDIGVSNLMYDRRENECVGILNDFDLATVTRDANQNRNHNQTGTTPFMALNLLTPDGQDGMIKHLYRHDLESFGWVLLWIARTYRDKGKEIRPLPFRNWLQPDLDNCHDAKLGAQRVGEGLQKEYYGKYRVTASAIAQSWISGQSAWRWPKMKATQLHRTFVRTETSEETVLKTILDLVSEAADSSSENATLPADLESLQRVAIGEPLLQTGALGGEVVGEQP